MSSSVAGVRKGPRLSGGESDDVPASASCVGCVGASAAGPRIHRNEGAFQSALRPRGWSGRPHVSSRSRRQCRDEVLAKGTCSQSQSHVRSRAHDRDQSWERWLGLAWRSVLTVQVRTWPGEGCSHGGCWWRPEKGDVLQYSCGQPELRQVTGQLPDWLGSTGGGLHRPDLMRCLWSTSARPCDGSCTGKASEAVDACVGGSRKYSE